jgi:hypothetical protein
MATLANGCFDRSADAWFERTTRRIDAMKIIEDRLAEDLNRLCAEKLAEYSANVGIAGADGIDAVTATAPLVMLVTDVDPALNSLGLGGGVDVLTIDGPQPKPMRSMLAVLRAQSRQIQKVSSQLESARTALIERKVIERAKGLLMKSRKLSEEQAYAQIRQAAMNQNKRIIEVAEAIVNMADILLA